VVDIILESLRLLFVLAIVWEIHRQSEAREVTSRNGWKYIQYGFWLILFGSAMDLTDNFEGLNDYIIIGDTPSQAFLEKLIGYLGGFSFLALGLQKWLPSVKVMSDEVSARKKSEHQLAELNNKYQFHISETPVAFIEWDKENKITSWNKAAENIFGYKEQEVLGTDLELIFQSGTVLDQNGDSQRGNSVQFNDQNITKEGRMIICKWACKPLFDELEQLAGHVALAQDITETEWTKERLELVIKSEDTGLWVWTYPNNSAYWSDRLFTLLGYSPGELAVEQGTWLTLLYSDERQQAKSLFEKHLIAGMPSYSAEYQLRTKSGEYRWYKLNAQAIWDSSGCLLRVAGSIKDINQQKRAEQALIEAKKDAVYANQAKCDVLSTMNHEVRAPINDIVGMVDLLQHSSLNTDQKHKLNTVRQSSTDLLNIIDDILDLSKIEANEMILKIEPFSVTELIENIATSMSNGTNNKGLHFWLDLPSNLPSSLLGDKTRIRQILLNFMSNAIKFTENKPDEQSEIALKCECITSPDTNHAKLSISVRDNGIGISRDAQENLFAPFSQADESSPRRFAGTGLGLAICKELVTLMDGDITLNSRLGEGSIFTFTVTLPIAADSGYPDDNKDLAQTNILVLYQQAEWRNILESILPDREENTEYKNLFDPEAALSSMPMLGKHNRVVIVFTPEWSSFTIESFQQELKKAERHNEIKLIQLMNGSYPEQGMNLENTFRVDANPVIPSDLINKIIQAAESQPSICHDANLPIKQKQESSTAKPSESISKILIVEDNSVDQDVLLQQLNLHGYKTSIASNGCEALAMWASEKFDLILTDYHMPEMGGIELTERIRQAEADLGTQTPIIGITANALSGVKERCISAGMNECLNKPVPHSELGEVLNRWLGAVYIAVIDPSCLSQLVGDDPQLHTQFLKKFQLQAFDTLSQIKKAAEDGESESIRAASHKLKSSARAVGALQAANLFNYLEVVAKDEDWIVINSCINDIDKQLSEINKYCGVE